MLLARLAAYDDDVGCLLVRSECDAFRSERCEGLRILRDLIFCCRYAGHRSGQRHASEYGQRISAAHTSTSMSVSGNREQ